MNMVGENLARRIFRRGGYVYGRWKQKIQV